jgi:alpha-galactosidase
MTLDGDGRNPVVVLIGAGSMVFTQTVVSDLVQSEATRDAELRLVDIAEDALGHAMDVVRRIQEEAGGRGRVVGSADRREVLRGADYVITTIQVGGDDAIRADFEIPARYGIKQTVGDTLGIGGISRALRTIPVELDIVHDVEELAPDALYLNYSNPMSMIVMAIARSSGLRHLGLCHSIPHTVAQIAMYLGLSPVDISWRAAGINHMAWILTLEDDGDDLYPRLVERSLDPEIFVHDGVRFELLRHFGYFVTESSKHNAEYTSYFITHSEEVSRLQIEVNERVERMAKRAARRAQESSPRRNSMRPKSSEYAPAIIAALESGADFSFYANVQNDGLISNLPAGAAVEVPCFVQGGQLYKATVGALPEGPAALNRQAVSVQDLAVEGVLRNDRDLIYQAAMMDPQVSAVLTLPRVVNLVDDLVRAHEGRVPALPSRRLFVKVD